MQQALIAGLSGHSVTGLDDFLTDEERRPRMANTAANRRLFFAVGDDLLIHKTKNSLWHMVDGKIEPVFEHDILSAEDLKALEGQQQEQ